MIVSCFSVVFNYFVQFYDEDRQWESMVCKIISENGHGNRPRTDFPKRRTR